MNYVILAIILAAFHTVSLLQSLDIEAIDEYVKKVNTRVNNTDAPTGDYLTYTLNLEMNRRAAGLQNTLVKYYFDYPESPTNEISDGASFGYKYRPAFKINVSYNIASSQRNEIEYFYKEGLLVYYHFKTTGSLNCGEEKVYFQNNEVIRMESIPMDCPEIKNGANKFKDYSKASDFSIDEKTQASKIQQKAAEYQKAFGGLNKLEDLEKDM